VGQWERGKPHGIGRLEDYNTGDCYDGQWRNGLRDGQGSFLTCLPGSSASSDFDMFRFVYDRTRRNDLSFAMEEWRTCRN